jgi:hypothetical protein
MPVVDRLSHHAIFTDGIWLFDHILEIVGWPFFVSLVVWLELFVFYVELVVVRSRLLLAV